jgi:hypothetical protein
VSVVIDQVELSASARSLVQRSPNERNVSECVRAAWIMWRPWPTRGWLHHEKSISYRDYSVVEILNRSTEISGVLNLNWSPAFSLADQYSGIQM